MYMVREDSDLKASIRINSLSLSGFGSTTLGSMEAHGKRQDKTSRARQVRDREPLVYGSLDLRDAFDRHVSGCRMNKGLKRPAMHALVQFPTQLKVTKDNEKRMLAYAIQFINEAHGGDAVFAARLDRDEQGQHTVDVFYSPKYEKVTKSRGVETWISTTKHGKELCEKHRDEIKRRHGGRFLTGPRQVGIAMQSELRAFLTLKNLKLDAKREKSHGSADRLEPETYKMQQELRIQKKNLEADLVDALKLQMQMKITQKELTEAVSDFQRAIPVGYLRDKVAGALDRMKTALKKVGIDLEKMGDRADAIMDRKSDGIPQPSRIRGKSEPDTDDNDTSIPMMM